MKTFLYTLSTLSTLTDTDEYKMFPRQGCRFHPDESPITLTKHRDQLVTNHCCALPSRQASPRPAPPHRFPLIALRSARMFCTARTTATVFPGMNCTDCLWERDVLRDPFR